VMVSYGIKSACTLLEHAWHEVSRVGVPGGEEMGQNLEIIKEKRAKTTR